MPIPVGYLDRLTNVYGIKILAPVDDAVFNQWASINDWIDSDFRDMYKTCNGFVFEGGKVLPIFDAKNPKNTWDSLERANSVNSSKFFRDDLFLSEFYIFIEGLGMSFGAVRKADYSLWFESGGDMHQSTAGFLEFVELFIKDSE